MTARLLPLLMLAALLGGCATVDPATRAIAPAGAALSSEDHLRIATFLEEKAFAYDDEADDQQWLAHSLQPGAAPATAQLAALDRQLLGHLRAAASTARAMAAEHRRVAGTPGI